MVDPAIPNRQNHPGLHLLDLLLTVDDGMAAGNRRFLVLGRKNAPPYPA